MKERKLICIGGLGPYYGYYSMDDGWTYKFHFEKGETENYVYLTIKGNSLLRRWSLPDSYDYEECCNMLKKINYCKKLEVLDKFNVKCF